MKINISGDAVQGKHIGRIPQSVSFSSGNNTLSIPVFVIDNTEHEADRTLVVQLGSGSGYVISNPAGLQLQILDNDTPEPQIVLIAQAGPDTSGQVNEWIQLNGSVIFPSSNLFVTHIPRQFFLPPSLQARGARNPDGEESASSPGEVRRHSLADVHRHPHFPLHQTQSSARSRSR